MRRGSDAERAGHFLAAGIVGESQSWDDVPALSFGEIDSGRDGLGFLYRPSRRNISGEDSLASNKAGAFLP